LKRGQGLCFGFAVWITACQHALKRAKTALFAAKKQRAESGCQQATEGFVIKC